MYRKRLIALIVLCAVMLGAVSSVYAAELENLVAGLPYEASPRGVGFYQNFPEARRAPKLTDGQTLPSGENHNTGHPWLMAFQKAGAKGVDGGVIFDLGEEKEIQAVNLSLYAQKLSAYNFYYADVVTVSVSADGEVWEKVMEWENPISREEQESGIHWFEIPLPQGAQGRFVEVYFTAHTGTSIIFLDEIEILGR